MLEKPKPIDPEKKKALERVVDKQNSDPKTRSFIVYSDGSIYPPPKQTG